MNLLIQTVLSSQFPAGEILTEASPPPLQPTSTAQSADVCGQAKRGCQATEEAETKGEE